MTKKKQKNKRESSSWRETARYYYIIQLYISSLIISSGYFYRPNRESWYYSNGTPRGCRRIESRTKFSFCKSEKKKNKSNNASTQNECGKLIFRVIGIIYSSNTIAPSYVHLHLLKPSYRLNIYPSTEYYYFNLHATRLKINKTEIIKANKTVWFRNCRHNTLVIYRAT